MPFSSRRRWSASSTGRELLSRRTGARAGRRLDAVAGERQHEGRRVLALARGDGAAPSRRGASTGRAAAARVGGSRRGSAAGHRRDDRVLARAGDRVKVLSGDAPETVAAIARDVGYRSPVVYEGAAIPEDAQDRREFATRPRWSGGSRPRASRRSSRRCARGTLRGDGRRRCQRRAGAEELAPGDRAGQRHRRWHAASPIWC